MALDDFNKSIELDSQFAEAYESRAWLNRKIGNTEDYLADIEKYNQLRKKEIKQTDRKVKR